MELPTGLFNMPLVVELFKCFFPLKLHREVTDNNQCFIMYWRHMSVFQSIAHGPTIQFMECLLRIQIPRPHSSSSTSQLRWAFRVSVPQTPQNIAHWQLRTTRMGSRENMFDGCLFVGAELSHAHWDRRLCLCFCTSQCSHTNSPFTSNYKLSPGCWLASQLFRDDFDLLNHLWLMAKRNRETCLPKPLPSWVTTGHLRRLHMLITWETWERLE